MNSGHLFQFILHFNVFAEKLTVSSPNDIDLMDRNLTVSRYSAKSIKGFVESVEKRKFRGKREKGSESRKIRAMKNGESVLYGGMCIECKIQKSRFCSSRIGLKIGLSANTCSLTITLNEQRNNYSDRTAAAASSA